MTNSYLKGNYIMRIKQQKQIKALFIAEYGKAKGNILFSKQSDILDTLIKNTDGKNKSQMKTLIQTILPRIALYKTLQNDNSRQNDVYEIMRKYMTNEVGAKKHSFTANLEKIPFFFALYKKTFLRIMRTTTLQESEQTCGCDFFDITIKKCLWHTACVENGCAELCPLFCDVDDVTYGGLKKMGFSRTQTLGYGGDCCDFHFYRK